MPSNKTRRGAGASGRSTTKVPVGRILPGDNDRKEFRADQLAELAASIKANGLIQPITVVPVTDSAAPNAAPMFRIVAGERRWRAHILLGKDEIEAIVRDDLDATAEATAMLVENVVRADLDPVAEAVAYQTRLTQFGQTIEQLAESTGKSAAHIQRRLRLLDLATDVRGMVSQGHVPLAYADLMAGLDPNRQRAAMRVAAAQKHGTMLTVDGFREVIIRLREEQDQDTMFELADFFATQATTTAKGGERAEWWRDVVPTADDLPAPRVARSMSYGRMIEGWAADLEAAGEHRAAQAVGKLLAAMLEKSVATITPGGPLSPNQPRAAAKAA